MEINFLSDMKTINAIVTSPDEFKVYLYFFLFILKISTTPDLFFNYINTYQMSHVKIDMQDHARLNKLLACIFSMRISDACSRAPSIEI